LYELAKRFKKVFPHFKIVILNSNEPKYQYGDLYFLTTNQLIRFHDFFTVVIIDEVDAFPFEINKKFYNAARLALTKNSSRFYFLTATPTKLIKSLNFETVIINERFHGSPIPIPVVKIL